MLIQLRAHVVDVALDDDHGVGREPRRRLRGFSEQHAEHVRPVGESARPRAVADVERSEVLRRSRDRAETPEDRRTRRRDHLPDPVAEDDVEALEQRDRRRRGHGQPAVPALDHAAPERQRPDVDGGDAERFDRKRRRHHVRNRVGAPDLVEVHLVRRRPMDARLDLGENAKDRERTFAHARREPTAFDDGTDHGEGPLVRRLARGHHEPGRRDASDLTALRGDPQVRQAEAVDRRPELRERHPEVEQRAHGHVAGESREGVEEGLHAGLVARRTRDRKAASLQSFSAVLPSCALVSQRHA